MKTLENPLTMALAKHLMKPPSEASSSFANPLVKTLVKALAKHLVKPPVALQSP